MVKKPLPSLDNDRIIKTDNLTPPNLGGGDSDIKDKSINDKQISNDNEIVNGELSQASDEEPNASLLSIRLKSTHPTNYRYRGGLKFTYDEQVLDMSELTDEQIITIKSDEALIVSEL